MNNHDRWNLTAFYISGIIFSLMLMTGCYALNSANTTVRVLKTADTCEAEYSSNKEQVGLEASVCGGNVKVDKSGSNDAVIAATAAVQLRLLEIIQQLMTPKPAPVPVK